MNNLSKQAKQKQSTASTITISLPRAFYKAYFDLELWDMGFKSFSDMVRDSVRIQLERLRNRIELKKMREEKLDYTKD